MHILNVRLFAKKGVSRPSHRPTRCQCARYLYACWSFTSLLTYV